MQSISTVCNLLPIWAIISHLGNFITISCPNGKVAHLGNPIILPKWEIFPCSQWQKNCPVGQLDKIENSSGPEVQMC